MSETNMIFLTLLNNFSEAKIVRRTFNRVMIFIFISFVKNQS